MNTLVTHLQPEKMHKKLQLLLKCVCKAHGYKIIQKKKFITNLYSALQTAQNEGYNYELCLLHIIQFIPLPVLGMLHKSYSRVSLSIAYFDPQPCKVQPLFLLSSLITFNPPRQNYKAPCASCFHFSSKGHRTIRQPTTCI